MARASAFLMAWVLAVAGAVAAGIAPAGASVTPAVAAVNSFTIAAGQSAPLGDVTVTEATAGELPVGDVFTFQFKDSTGAATLHFATAGTVGGTNGLAATAAVASSNVSGTPLDDEVKVTVTAASTGSSFPGVLTLSGLTVAVGSTAASGNDQVVVSDTHPTLPAPVTVSDAAVAASGTLMAPYAAQQTPTILGTANGQSVGNVTLTEPAKSFFHTGDVITMTLRDADGSANTVGLGGTPYAAGGSMTVSVSGESGPTVQTNDTAFEVDVVAGDPSQGSASTITVSNLVVNTAEAPLGPVTLAAVVTSGPDAGVPLYPGRVAVANVGGNTTTSSSGSPLLSIGVTAQLAGNVTIAATAGSLVHGDTISLQIQTAGVTFTAAAPPVATVTSGSLVLADAAATLDVTDTIASWTVADGNLTASTMVVGPISYDVGGGATAGQTVTLLASGEAGSAFTSQVVSDAAVASPPAVGVFATGAAGPVPSTGTAPFDGAPVVYTEASAGATPVGSSIVLISPYATQIAAYRTTFAAVPSATTTGGLTLGAPTVNSSATVVATPQGTINAPAQTVAVFPVTAASTSAGTATFSGLVFGVGSLVPPGTLLVSGVVEAAGGLTTASAGNVAVDLVDTHGLGTSAATTPPVVSFTQTPPAVTNLTYATFAFLADETGSTFACALDGIVVSLNCPTPITLPGLRSGSHTFTVQAFNPGGFGSTPLSFTWTVDAVPPTAAVALPAAVTGSLAVTFSTPVDGIGPATVVLSQLPVSGPPVTMPATLTCVTQANVSGTCVGASFFTKVLVQPAAQLVPGQHYVLMLNPTGVTPAITDQAGNVLVTVAHAFRGGLVQDDDSPAAVPSWTTVTAASASGGSYAVADLGGSTASFTFTGTAITWHTVTGPGQGDANVYVDGVLNAAVDNYSATTRYKVARTVTGLTAGAHSLRIVVRGVKGAAAGTGTQVAVDDFQVGTTVTQQNAPGVHYAWTSVAAPAATGGRYAEAELAGAKYSFTFRGTAVRWVTVVGPAMGEAAVYLDGVLKSTVNGYASRAAYGVGRSLTGLTDAVHTLVVVVLGKHTAPSTANTVAVDGFVVS